MLVDMARSACSSCGGENDRSPQRYCSSCHAEYMTGWRSKQQLTGNERAFLHAAFEHWIAEELSSGMNAGWLYALGRKVLGREWRSDAERARTS